MSYALSKGGISYISPIPHIPSKSLRDYGYIKVYVFKSPTDSSCRIVHLNAEKLKIANSFDPCQPARTAQADMNRYFSQMLEASFSRSTDRIVLRHVRCLVVAHTSNNDISAVL